MKKGCIVTLHGNYNYGNRLQCYAVQKKLSNFGYKTDILRNIQINTIKGFIKFVILKMKWYKNENFKQFEKDNLVLSKKTIYNGKGIRKTEKNYDFYAIGSDQVWSPEIGLPKKLMFLDNINKRKIAFSASIGVDGIPESEKEFYKKGIKSMYKISVREEKAKEALDELETSKDVQVLLDPTMLLTKEEWESVAKKPTEYSSEKYIFAYFLGEIPKEAQELMDRLSKDGNYKIINPLDENDKYYNAGPAEFVYLEKNAEMIFTDSFHSCVFGILMDTPFVVFERMCRLKSMNSRLATLLKKFDLENRRYNKNMNIEEIMQFDNKKIELILNEERKKADEFIKEALS